MALCITILHNSTNHLDLSNIADLGFSRFRDTAFEEAAFFDAKCRHIAQASQVMVPLPFHSTTTGARDNFFLILRIFRMRDPSRCCQRTCASGRARCWLAWAEYLPCQHCPRYHCFFHAWYFTLILPSIQHPAALSQIWKPSLLGVGLRNFA